MNHHRIFISYKSDDEYFARGIVESLESMGIFCWIASRNIAEGSAFNREIPIAIEKAELIVLILTKKADESEEVQRELALATQYKKKILPINVDGCKPVNLHYWLSTIQWLSFIEYGGFSSIAEDIGSNYFNVIATKKNKSSITVKASRNIPFFSGAPLQRSSHDLTSITNKIGLRGTASVRYFDDDFAVLILREELTFADPIELLRDRRRIHLDIICSSEILSKLMSATAPKNPLFLDAPPRIEYVMSVYQIIEAEGLRESDIYAICEPSLVGITDDPNQEGASNDDAIISLANIKPTIALSQLTTVTTKTSCFYVGWSNVVLVDKEKLSQDFRRLEELEVELQKLWFQMNAYEAHLDKCIISPELYDISAIRREINKSKLKLAKFKKVDAVGSAHINAVKEALLATSRIKEIVASIDEKLKML